jgi:DNA-binding transcriptional MerR regulator
MQLQVNLKSSEMSDLDIAQVAHQSGLPASALRFYEEKGLIASIGRRGLRRVFDPKVLERLALIALGRTAGFSLEEIARMFAPDGRVRIDRQMLRAKAQEMDRTIRRLSAMRDGLQHAAACPAPRHMECPTFRRLLRAAASGAIRAGRNARNGMNPSFRRKPESSVSGVARKVAGPRLAPGDGHIRAPAAR